ncbi:MAG: UDP-N-acetylmuramoyl-L-alanine--D-glutamate ligase [Bacteroidales bacterium]|nr:UDP-N-acetylmuramoyl-L-alanine--D-glutamate ligase [Bacteroidales bacterium]
MSKTVENFIIENFQNKKVLILGFGREGKSTFNLLRKFLPQKEIFIADKNDKLKEELCFNLTDKNMSLILGENYLDSLSDFDLIIKSPGISLKDKNLDISKIIVTSQSDLFLQMFSDQIIGISGTKGKSTTASLIEHIIKQCSKNVLLVGNIGLPPFEIISEINKKTRIVFELSSHQLEFVQSSPHIAILLNFYQEHLDHYKNFADYKNAKLNIAKFQKENDFLIYNSDDKQIEELIKEKNFKQNIIRYSKKNNHEKNCYISENNIVYSNSQEEDVLVDLNHRRFLRGEHNISNILAAVCACKILKISDAAIRKGIESFKSLEHRLEYVGEYGNIHFYNDSIATIPEATIEAVKTLKDVDTLILGGFDRGINYEDLIYFIKETKISNLIFLGDRSNRLYVEMQKNIQDKLFFTVKSFSEAAKIIQTYTKPMSVCLLSPAAASYNLFSNFEERGNEFKKMVKKLNQFIIVD